LPRAGAWSGVVYRRARFNVGRGST